MSALAIVVCIVLIVGIVLVSLFGYVFYSIVKDAEDTTVDFEEYYDN